MTTAATLIAEHNKWLRARKVPQRFTDALARIEDGDICADPNPNDLRPQFDRPPYCSVTPVIEAEGLAHLSPLDGIFWTPVLHGPEAPQPLAHQMFGSMLGYRVLSTPETQIAFGLFSLDRDTHYPLHSHAAEEIYICLSGKVEVQHGFDGVGHTLTPGDVSLTPSACIHALITQDVPVLLAYIWLGDNLAPNYWWHQTKDGRWCSSAWQWSDAGLWTRI